MLASFSVVPMGAGEGVKKIVAEALAIVDGSGLSYQLGPMHTVIEGEPEQVLDVILCCHRRVLELAPRVLTNITLDDRKGVTGRLRGKVRDVEQILGKPLSRPYPLPACLQMERRQCAASSPKPNKFVMIRTLRFSRFEPSKARKGSEHSKSSDA